MIVGTIPDTIQEPITAPTDISIIAANITFLHPSRKNSSISLTLNPLARPIIADATIDIKNTTCVDILNTPNPPINITANPTMHNIAMPKLTCLLSLFILLFEPCFI